MAVSCSLRCSGSPGGLLAGHHQPGDRALAVRVQVDHDRAEIRVIVPAVPAQPRHLWVREADEAAQVVQVTVVAYERRAIGARVDGVPGQVTELGALLRG